MRRGPWSSGTCARRGSNHGETRSHTLVVGSKTEQLKITLVWTDAPRYELAYAMPVVNNLDLRVTAPDRTKYQGNDLTHGVSTPNGNQPTR